MRAMDLVGRAALVFAVAGCGRGGDGVARDGVQIAPTRLGPSEAVPGAQVGAAVAVEGDQIVAGAPFHQGSAVESGAVYLFARAGGIWTQQAELGSVTAMESEDLGAAVGVSGGAIVGGAPCSLAEPEIGVGAAY